jgi:S-(hydroxymethyl)glutathione dehydrogenase / alcohol dehydrogenase
MQGVIARNGRYELVEDLEVRETGPHEVKVAVTASGICRSDLLLLEQPAPYPTVLGHEAAGRVVEIGSAVEGLSIGDQVAVTCQRPCLRCEQCARGRYSACPTSMSDPSEPFTHRGEPVRSLARSSSLCETIVVDALQAHRVDHLSAGAAALLGCAVSTGYGMVAKVGDLRAGESVAVFGVGGIGINSIQTAHLLGARRIVAIDVNPAKEAIARQFGADAFVTAGIGEAADGLAERVREAAMGPVDVVVEGTGVPSVVTAGLATLASGGRLALVGIPVTPTGVPFDLMDLMGRHLRVEGALNGACDPFVDMPNIVRYAENGRLNLEDQISHRFPLDEIDRAIDALRSGETMRVVVEIGQ